MISSGPLSGRDKGCAVRAGFRASQAWRLEQSPQVQKIELTSSAVQPCRIVALSRRPTPALSLPAPIPRAGAANGSARIDCVVGHPPMKSGGGTKRKGENEYCKLLPFGEPPVIRFLSSGLHAPNLDDYHMERDTGMHTLGVFWIWILMTAFCWRAVS